MSLPSDTKYAPNPDYQQAEQFINKTISNMGSESHVEYSTTMDRNTNPSKWRKWLNQLLRIHT